VHIGYQPGEGALAWLCAGWLASRLRWPAGAWPAMEEAKGDDILSIRAGSISGSLDEHRALVQLADAAPFIVSVPRAGDAEAIAAELRSLTIDRTLQAAMTALNAG